MCIYCCCLVVSGEYYPERFEVIFQDIKNIVPDKQFDSFSLDTGAGKL
jgi:hypothetical protein